MLRLQKYDVNVIYWPGTKIPPVVDTLSGQFLKTSDSEDNSFNSQVHTVMKNIPISDHKIEELKAASNADTQMTQLKATILNGWPRKRCQCHSTVTDFWNYRDELTVIDDIVLKGERIVIPKALRQDMLKCIHNGHMGMEKCKRRARDILFWPGMNRHIEEVVSQCNTCQENRMANIKEPLIPHQVPDRPWQFVATDIFTLDEEKYLVVADYYSRYFEIERLRGLKASVIIHKTKAWDS